MSLPFNITNPGWNIDGLLTSQEAQYVTDLVLAGGSASENEVLTWKSGAPSWEPAASVGGYTNLTQFVAQTAWRLFYSNTDGDVTELALGADGTYLKSNGAAAAPSFATVAGTGDVVGPASATDEAVVRFNTTTGKLVQNSTVTISDNADISAYDPTNDGNPVFSLGSGSGERMRITANYTGGAQTLSYMLFNTDTTSAGVNAGMYRFAVDLVNILDIEDDGIDMAAGMKYKLNSSAVLSESGGVNTLSNINAIDATTETTLEAALDFAPALGVDDNYVTDAEKVVIGNTSGTNTGDNAVNSNYSGLVTNATHTGDVTGATALTIAAKAVTLAKMDDVATGTVFYRKTALTGVPEVQTLATLKTDLGLTGTNSGDQDLSALAPKASPTFTGTVTLPTGLTGVLRADSGVVSTDSDVTDLVSSASDTVAGKVELATTAEVNTGTDTGRAVTPDGLAGSYAGTKSLSMQVTDGTTDVATGDGKGYITIPESLNGMNLVRAQATVVTAGTTNATTVMIHNKTDAQDMLSGAISIASGGTVGTVGTVNGSYDDVATNDVLRIDVDSVSTTAPKGLMIVLEFRLP